MHANGPGAWGSGAVVERSEPGSARTEVQAGQRAQIGRIAEPDLDLGEEATAALGGDVGTDDELATGIRGRGVAAGTGVVERVEVDAHTAAQVRLPRGARGEAVVEVPVDRERGGATAQTEVEARHEVELRGDLVPLQLTADHELIEALTEAEVRTVGGERIGRRDDRKSDDERARLTEAAMALKAELTDYNGRGAHDRLRVHVDAREGLKPGAKYYEWELQGVPLRLELGPKDLEKGSVFSARRDTRAKAAIPRDGVAASVVALLETIQNDLLAAAKARRDANTHRNVTSYEEFKQIMEGPGGFVYAGWNGDPAVEARVKEETKATIRVIPDAEFRSAEAPTTCIVTGEPAKYEVVWAKAY